MLSIQLIVRVLSSGYINDAASTENRDRLEKKNKINNSVDFFFRNRKRLVIYMIYL